jgi:hypothetical protein
LLTLPYAIISAFANGRPVERRCRRHGCDRARFGHAEIFRLRAIAAQRAHAEDAVPGLERGNAGTDGINLPGKVHPQDRSFRKAARNDPPRQHGVPKLAAVRAIDRGRVHPDQDFVCRARRFRHLPDLNRPSRSEMGDNGRFHHGHQRKLSSVPCLAAGSTPLTKLSVRPLQEA